MRRFAKRPLETSSRLVDRPVTAFILLPPDNRVKSSAMVFESDDCGSHKVRERLTMLDPVDGMPSGVFGLTATGTVIAQDVAQALVLAKPASAFILFVDPDLDGYLSEIVSALETAAAAQPPRFKRWALVVPDGVLSEADQYMHGLEPRVFPQSRRQDAVAWASGADG